MVKKDSGSVPLFVTPQYRKVRRKKRTQTVNKEPSMAQQQFKDASMISNILARYKDLNRNPHLLPDLSLFQDVSNVPVYERGLDVIANANEQFMKLPSKVRAEFGNDPKKLLSFLSDVKNKEKAIELGLIQVKEPIKPQVEAPEPKGTSAGQTAGTPAVGQPSAK